VYMKDLYSLCQIEHLVRLSSWFQKESLRYLFYQSVGSVAALKLPPTTYVASNENQGCFLHRATQGQTGLDFSSDQGFGVRWVCV
jgi:hypothetical protein